MKNKTSKKKIGCLLQIVPVVLLTLTSMFAVGQIYNCRSNQNIAEAMHWDTYTWGMFTSITPVNGFVGGETHLRFSSGNTPTFEGEFFYHFDPILVNRFYSFALSLFYSPILNYFGASNSSTILYMRSGASGTAPFDPVHIAPTIQNRAVYFTTFQGALPHVFLRVRFRAYSGHRAFGLLRRYFETRYNMTFPANQWVTLPDGYDLMTIGEEGSFRQLHTFTEDELFSDWGSDGIHYPSWRQGYDEGRGVGAHYGNPTTWFRTIIGFFFTIIYTMNTLYVLPGITLGGLLGFLLFLSLIGTFIGINIFSGGDY